MPEEKIVELGKSSGRIEQEVLGLDVTITELEKSSGRVEQEILGLDIPVAAAYWLMSDDGNLRSGGTAWRKLV